MEKLIIFYVLICNILGARYRFNQCASNHFECIKYQIATQFTRIFERSDIVNDWIFKLDQSMSELNSTTLYHRDIINNSQLAIASIVSQQEDIRDWREIVEIFMTASEEKIDHLQEKVIDYESILFRIKDEDIRERRQVVDTFMSASEEKMIQLQEKVNDFESALSRIRVNINECFSSACQNGGVCNVGVNHYTCNCVTGFAGTNCELNINECSSSPCQHDGVCNDGVDQYTCDCTIGFTGSNCELNIDECSSSPCGNGWVCNDGVGQYTCDCATGFAGPNCEHNVTICDQNVLNEVGKCFWIPMGLYNYREGEALCAQYNGHAGHVKTGEINNSLLRHMNIYWNQSRFVWIGLLRDPDGWMWSDGDLATWQIWYMLDEYGGCAAHRFFFGGWYTLECSSRRRMLCEIDLV